jgi:nucleotide-binding universal stress UspA family protein
MLRNILVPLDGSPISEAALPYARAMAARANARLTLVRVVPLDRMPTETIQEAEAYLGRFATELSAAGLAVETGVPYSGTTPEWIQTEAKLRHADLVVMATHARTGFDHFVHGSVAEAVIPKLDIPLVLIRPGEGLSPADRFAQSQPTLIVPLDGSEFAEAALEPARELAALVGARLVLVGVVPLPTAPIAAEGPIVYPSDEDVDALEAEARGYLTGICDRLMAGGIAASVEVRRLGEAATRIAEVAAEQGAAAVVMATHGRTGLARALIGSVAGAIVHQGTTPVVLVRPAKLRPAEEPAIQAAPQPTFAAG